MVDNGEKKLRVPYGLAVYGNEEIDAEIERVVDGVDAVPLIGAAPHPAADRPGAQRDARGLERQSGNLDVFHAYDSSSRKCWSRRRSLGSSSLRRAANC